MFVGKRIFLRLRNGRSYFGKLIENEYDKNGDFFWLKIKFDDGRSAVVVSSEIVEFKEEN